MKYKITLIVVLLSTACSKNYFFQEFKSIEEGWDRNEHVSFDVHISDPLDVYQLFIDIRHPNNYSYENLWVFMTTTSSSKKYYKDTLNLQLAFPDGRWKGKSVSGGEINHHILFKKDFTFKDTGDYKFSFQQAMRVKEVSIRDFGFIIQKGPLL